jgi:GT2 family glycosyltransferase/glycosyltransferase involved in cell wall biosynthesis
MTPPESTLEGAERPSVTVIVLNHEGVEYVSECLDSLAKLDYPQDRLDLMMLDNGSADDSMSRVRAQHPGVRVVESGKNLGSAGGRNLGARSASSDYIVFLDGDMAVDLGLVRCLVDAVGSDPAVVSAGAMVLDWGGNRLHFAGGICNFAGFAPDAGFEETYDPQRYSEVSPALFAGGGAMIIDRRVFLDVGGFDDDYFSYLEDVDLGWRLWVQGYKVVFAPDARAYRKQEGPDDELPDRRKDLLCWRNAFCSMLKNYDDSSLARVLPAALFGAAASVVEHAVDVGRLDLDSYSITNEKKMSGSSVSLDKSSISGLVAIHEIAGDLGSWMEKRRSVQGKRKRTDEEIVQLFRPYFPPSRPWRWPETMYTVAGGLGVHDLFAGAPRRILIVSPDVLPYPGLPTVGSGLRAWGLGQGLKTCGHDVVFSMPKGAVDRFEGQVSPEVAKLSWGMHGVSAVIASVQPDVVLVSGWPVMLHLQGPPDVPVILDQHGPHMLEREFQSYSTVEANSDEKLKALRMADYFICAGEKQFTYFQEWLARAGWNEQERRERSAAIPVSLSPDLPERRPGQPLTFVYGGVFLPWQDPSAALSALVEELDRRNSARLLLFGGRHPFYPVEGGVTEELLKRLEQSPNVVAPKMVSHDELIDTYATAHVAVDVMKANAERKLAFTTRTVEYLWCGLPVIYNDYAELAEYIREYEAGWTVDPEDLDGIAHVFSEILEHPEQIEVRGRNAQRLVRERLTWDRTIQPADRFVRYPSLRPGSSRQRVTPVPPEVALLVRRLGDVLPAPARRGARRVVRSLTGMEHQEGADGNQAVPPELVQLLGRIKSHVPLSVTRRARRALGHLVRG